MAQPLRGEPGDVVVVVFSSTDCPIANALAPELEKIHREVEQRGGRFYLVHAREDLKADAATAHAGRYGLTMPLLIDDQLALVAELEASVTPEAVVVCFDRANRWVLHYRGRVNDLYVALGKRRAAVTEHDLRRAIDAAFDGQPIDFAPVPAVGCLIEGL